MPWHHEFDYVSLTTIIYCFQPTCAATRLLYSTFRIVAKLQHWSSGNYSSALSLREQDFEFHYFPISSRADNLKLKIKSSITSFSVKVNSDSISNKRTGKIPNSAYVFNINRFLYGVFH